MTELQTREPDEPDDESNESVDLEPPDLRKPRFGILGEVLQLRRYIKKRRKMVSKGYVEWVLIDDSYPKPRYIKPKPRGGGIREYKHKGERYLFPEKAMLPNEVNGAWTVVHKRGNAEPINLRDPDENAIPVDVLEEYLQMRVSSSPPSLLDKLDLDPKDIFVYMIVAIVGFAFLQGVLF